VLSTLGLDTIEILKYLIGRLKKLLIGWKNVRQLGCSAKELRQDLTLVRLGQGLEGFQKMPRCVSHGGIFYPYCSRGVMRALSGRRNAKRGGNPAATLCLGIRRPGQDR
jgi:hypothetical protein